MTEAPLKPQLYGKGEAEERGQRPVPGRWGKNKVVSARYWDAGRICILATHLANQGVAMQVLMWHVSMKYVLVLSGQWIPCCQQHTLPEGGGGGGWLLGWVCWKILECYLSTSVVMTKGNCFSSTLLKERFLCSVGVDSVLTNKVSVPILGRCAWELKTIEESDGKIHCTAESSRLTDSW